MRVCVIGSGCAGLGAAWHLNRSGVEVELFESADRAGGHANTILVDRTDTSDGVEIDTGFMVFNSRNYPHLCSLFEELGVQGEPTDMGFSVSMEDGSFEWCGSTFQGLFATPKNLFNPSFYAMLRDIVRFNTLAQKALSQPNSHAARSQTVRAFLEEHGLSDAFAKYYLIPMTAAIWSATTKDMLDFPAITLFTFLNNHLLLQVSTHIPWQTPASRSKTYVNAILKELAGRVHISCPIVAVRRKTDSVSGRLSIEVEEGSGRVTVFDRVIFACHPDQALRILGQDATEKEKNSLGMFHYAPNDTYVHCDESLMPKAKAAWTSWNYIGTNSTGAVTEEEGRPVYVTYWINQLQNLKYPKNIFVSLNPTRKPDPAKVFSRINYDHPQYTVKSVRAQETVRRNNGENGTYFCGAWMGYGFHEDGMRSGLEAAVAISGKQVPWADKLQKLSGKGSTLVPKSKGNSTSFLASLLQPWMRLLERFCKRQILSFLRTTVSRGRLTFNFDSNASQTFDGTKSLALATPNCQGPVGAVERPLQVSLTINKPWFWVRLALEGDLGMAKSYIAGEWAVDNAGSNVDGLTDFFLFLIDNMPNGKTRTSGGIDIANLATASIGSAINYMWYRLTMDNSIANSRSNIHAHYDLSNELFEIFLDKKHLMYSCALFETQMEPGGGLRFVDSLESAQTRKIDALLSRLEPLGPEHTLLDIGFGWGGICIRAAEKYGCKVHGITLSKEQAALAQDRVNAKGLEHLITFELVDYRVFASSGRKFDRIVSCEMIEAVGHNHLPSFFSAVDSLLKTEGIFVMQAITMPDARYPIYVKSADFCNTIVFPGGCCPSLSALLNAMATRSTLHLDNAININLHYAETLRQWRERFIQSAEQVRMLGFDDQFIRLWAYYLCYCEAGFKSQVINLQILTFSRTGNPNMVVQRTLPRLASAP